MAVHGQWRDDRLGGGRAVRTGVDRPARHHGPRALAARSRGRTRPRGGGEGVRIGVIGGGAWGTALAQVAAASDEPVLLWAREREVVNAINSEHENRLFLPGVPLSPTIKAAYSLGWLARCDALLVVVPVQYFRAVPTETAQTDGPLILCAKGIE